jgi:hypothetical protein
MYKDIAVSMIVRGTCHCGRSFMIFQPDLRDLALVERRNTSGTKDIFIADKPEDVCSQCGQAITLPVAEILNTDRTPIGRWMEKMRAKKQSSSTSEDSTQNNE